MTAEVKIDTDIQKMQINNRVEISLYNKSCTRHLYAKRHTTPSQHMWCGGGNYWEVHYTEVVYEKTRVMGALVEWGLCDGKSYGKANGVVIPKTVKTKKEVLDIAKAIGIFEVK